MQGTVETVPLREALDFLEGEPIYAVAYNDRLKLASPSWRITSVPATVATPGTGRVYCDLPNDQWIYFHDWIKPDDLPDLPDPPDTWHPYPEMPGAGDHELTQTIFFHVDEICSVTDTWGLAYRKWDGPIFDLPVDMQMHEAGVTDTHVFAREDHRMIIREHNMGAYREHSLYHVPSHDPVLSLRGDGELTSPIRVLADGRTLFRSHFELPMSLDGPWHLRLWEGPYPIVVENETYRLFFMPKEDGLHESDALASKASR